MGTTGLKAISVLREIPERHLHSRGHHRSGGGCRPDVATLDTGNGSCRLLALRRCLIKATFGAISNGHSRRSERDDPVAVIRESRRARGHGDCLEGTREVHSEASMSTQLRSASPTTHRRRGSHARIQGGGRNNTHLRASAHPRERALDCRRSATCTPLKWTEDDWNQSSGTLTSCCC